MSSRWSKNVPTEMWKDMRFVLHLYGMQVNVNVKECTAGGSWFPLMTQMVKFQIFPNSKNLRSNESQKCHSADVGWFTLCGKGQRYVTLMHLVKFQICTSYLDRSSFYMLIDCNVTSPEKQFV